MYAGDQPLFAQPSLVKEEKKAIKLKDNYHSQTKVLQILMTIVIDVFQVFNVFSLKLSPPENDVLPLVFCEVTVVAKLCFCIPS